MSKKKYNDLLSNEYNKLKQMNTRGKLRYLWDYYKSILFLLILVIFALFYIGDALVQHSKEMVLQGFFSNDDYNLFDADVIADDFSNYLNLSSKQRVFFDDSLYVELDSSAEYVVASQGKISAYIAAKELDFLITTSDLAKHYSSKIPLMDLEASLPNDLLKNIGNHLRYIEGVDHKEGAYAIDLSDSRFIKDANYKGETSYYFIIPSNAVISEELIAFLKYAFKL